GPDRCRLREAVARTVRRRTTRRRSQSVDEVVGGMPECVRKAAGEIARGAVPDDLTLQKTGRVVELGVAIDRSTSGALDLGSLLPKGGEGRSRRGRRPVDGVPSRRDGLGLGPGAEITRLSLDRVVAPVSFPGRLGRIADAARLARGTDSEDCRRLLIGGFRR